MGLIREQGSYSTTFKKIDGIIQLMCNEIDNDQDIKKLLAYPTYNPLTSRGNTYDNKIIYQYDITKSMLDRISIDVSKNQDGSNLIDLPQCIFDMGWNSSKDIELKNAIYVSHVYSGTELVDTALFVVTIIVPSDYNRLLMETNTTRSHALAQRVINCFDRAKTDDVSSKELGDLEFKLGGKINEGKVTKGIDATVIEVPISIKMINARVENNGRICK